MINKVNHETACLFYVLTLTSKKKEKNVKKCTLKHNLIVITYLNGDLSCLLDTFNNCEDSKLLN